MEDCGSCDRWAQFAVRVSEDDDEPVFSCSDHVCRAIEEMVADLKHAARDPWIHVTAL